MDDAPKETLTNAEVQRYFQDGPQIGKSAVLVLIGDRMYKREGDGWRLLGNRHYRTVKELTEATSGP